MGFHPVAVVCKLVQKYIQIYTKGEPVHKTEYTKEKTDIQNKKNIPRILKNVSRVIGK